VSVRVIRVQKVLITEIPNEPFFLSSRGTEASGRKSKVMSREQFKTLLESKGFERVEIVAWWKWFDRVTARKPG